MTSSPLRLSDPQHVGSYRIVRRLGEGGMGAVYLGRDSAGRDVAVKVIRPELASDTIFRDRFRSEVKRARQVPPFCTAAVLDADADASTPYLVVEYVDGPSLAEIVDDRGPLSGGDLHSVAVGVTTALAAIHDAGVVHRDLKPANVLFALGTPKVIDFGIAKAVDATSQHTVPGQILGTIAYMGPERFTATTQTGPAADIFAWGAVIAFAATGRTPFTPEALTATAVGIPLPEPHLTALPEPLRQLVSRALDPDPARRPSAHELLEALLRAGAAGNPSVRASLEQHPDLRRAAAAVRRTVLQPAPPARGAARAKSNTLKSHAQLHTAHWLPRTSVLAVAAAALAAGLAVAPITDRISPPGPAQQNWPDAGQQRQSTDDDRASRAGSRTGCTLDGPIEATTREPRPYTCPATRTAGEQSIRTDIILSNTDTCAVVWSHVTGPARYQTTACTGYIALELFSGHHRRLGHFPLATPISAGRWHTLEILITPDTGISVTIDGHPAVTNHSAPLLARGAVTLGLAFAARNTPTRGTVGFRNVAVQ
ncbi:protein kinase [Actinoplanes sp. NPDC051633]|uniref:protein kinase domain-containing protein n=1 Tax=Actinoplanes sp. NPDC051633 TaxID=3155670 RepID=UPI0034393A1C